MSISIPSLSAIYTYASLSAERVMDVARKLLNRTYVFIQTQPGAYLALIGVNIVAFEVAVAICRIVHHVFGNKANQHQSESDFRGFVLLFGTIVIGTVYIGCNKLSLPVTTGKVIAVSFATNFIYLCCKSL